MPKLEPTAESISARATGSLFFATFGSFWLCLWLGMAHQLTIPTISGVAILLGLMVLAALRLQKAASKAPPTATDAETEKQNQRRFNRINMLQWAAIVAALVLLNILQQPNFIAPAIAIIVGLHLFPLARLFRNHTHYVTGTLLVLWSLAAIVSVPSAKVPALCSLGTALILLGSAAYTLIVNASAIL